MTSLIRPNFFISLFIVSPQEMEGRLVEPEMRRMQGNRSEVYIKRGVLRGEGGDSQTA